MSSAELPSRGTRRNLLQDYDGEASNCFQRPPVSVIVLRDESLPSVAMSSPYSPDTVAQRDKLGSSAVSNSTSISSAPSAPSTFRLQPRNPKCIRSPSHDGVDDVRGTKRRAHSLSEESPMPCSFKSTASESMTSLTHATTVKGSPLISPMRPADQTLAYFQALSLHSPVSTPYQRRTCFESPSSLAGSQSNRSSFLKYHDGSPSAGLFETSPGSASAMSKSQSHLLSPKRAPCTVLFGQQGEFSSGGHMDTTAKRPPLHSGMAHLMHSLDEEKHAVPAAALTSDTPTAAFREPPMCTVHCQSSLAASPGSWNSRLTDFPATPCSAADSPSRRSIMSAKSPACQQTPRPRLSLTPRSTGSQRHRTTELPIFPMDFEDSDGAFETQKSPRCPPTPPFIIRQDSVQKSSGSFLPVPNWDEPLRHGSGLRGAARGQKAQHMQHVTRTDPLEMIIAARTHKNAEHDNDSLSASDDDDDDQDFFLAAPLDLQEAKAAVTTQHFKHRRLDSWTSELPLRRLASLPPLAAGLTSNPSLLGMDFVTSSSNLQSMDRVGSRVFSHGSFEELSTVYPSSVPTSGQFDGSPTSVGLALEPTASNPRAWTDRNGRDLETPPVARAEPRSPPRLTFAKRNYESGKHTFQV